jgi:hypothetical protein
MYRSSRQRVYRESSRVPCRRDRPSIRRSRGRKRSSSAPLRPIHRFLPFYRGFTFFSQERILTRLVCCRSAKKPPVVAPSIAMTGTRGDPSLMRQFHNGSGNTGSPLRRDTRNPSGSSAASRNRDIIEEEDVDMDGGEALMIQARPRNKRAASPQRAQTRRALSPARGYQVNGLTASATVNSQEGAKSSSSSQKHRSKAIYDRITRNIDAALDAREQNLPITASGALFLGRCYSQLMSFFFQRLRRNALRIRKCSSRLGWITLTNTGWAMR